ncbi:unnamed protein product [Paramecium pentaurelia]|uniref:Uncharacterized protein n=1 Tax=Paramecium pentaurelia TaxID=43138 RepID=A0A8S1WH20_9CILI|nr:unnamed protein product [Paramecium pentaurelia]
MSMRQMVQMNVSLNQKEIAVNENFEGRYYSPQQFIKLKQLLMNMQDKSVNLIRLKENGKFKVKQSINLVPIVYLDT